MHSCTEPPGRSLKSFVHSSAPKLHSCTEAIGKLLNSFSAQQHNTAAYINICLRRFRRRGSRIELVACVLTFNATLYVQSPANRRLARPCSWLNDHDFIIAGRWCYRVVGGRRRVIRRDNWFALVASRIQRARFLKLLIRGSPLLQTAIEQIAFSSEGRQNPRVQATIEAFPGPDQGSRSPR